MVRIIVGLLVAALGAVTWVLLLPNAPTKRVEAAALPATEAKQSQPEPATSPAREVRLVYPGPGTTGAVRNISVDATPPVAPPQQAADTPVAPAQAAPVTASAEPPPAVPAGQDAAVAPPSGLVNINTASVDALNQIPGAGRIGRTIASHRPYRSVDDLLSKRVVRKSVYDKIKAQIATN